MAKQHNLKFAVTLCRKLIKASYCGTYELEFNVCTNILTMYKTVVKHNDCTELIMKDIDLRNHLCGLSKGIVAVLMHHFVSFDENPQLFTKENKQIFEELAYHLNLFFSVLKF